MPTTLAELHVPECYYAETRGDKACLHKVKQADQPRVCVQFERPLGDHGSDLRVSLIYYCGEFHVYCTKHGERGSGQVYRTTSDPAQAVQMLEEILILMSL